MVKRLRLNEKSVREAAPEPGRDYQIFDSEVRGFAICIYRSGNRAFTLDYRHAGRQRRMTLGRWPLASLGRMFTGMPASLMAWPVPGWRGLW